MVMRVKNFPNVFSYSMHGSSIGLGHMPFTYVRRVRFPYRVPNFGCVGKLVTPGDCKSSVVMALLVQVQPHPPYHLMLGRSRPSSPIPRITDAGTSGRCASQALPRVPMDDKLGSSCKQWEAQAAFFNVIAKHR